MSEQPQPLRAITRAQTNRRATLLRIALALTLTMLALLAPRVARAQDWRTVTSSRQVNGENTLHVHVEYAAGELKIGAAPRGTLYRSTLRYDADAFKPKVNYVGNRLNIGIQDGRVRGRNLKSGLLDLRLSPDVPLEVDLKFGAVEANLDLGGMRLRSLEVATGASSTRLTVSSPNRESCRKVEIAVGAAKFEATRLANLNAEYIKIEGGVGEMTLDFTGSMRQDLDVDVEMGLGSLTLRVPRGVGVRVEKDGFLASFDSQGLVKRGNVFYSEDYERATHKIKFNIDAALGSIKMVWVDG